MNSIPPIRDGYFSNQQGMQGLVWHLNFSSDIGFPDMNRNGFDKLVPFNFQGQLNSIQTRVGHYGTQQSMQGLVVYLTFFFFLVVNNVNKIRTMT